MSEEACPIPTNPAGRDRDAMGRMLNARTIAIVGLSDDPDRTSNHVGGYLQDAGFQIIPINPNCNIALGRPCLASLTDLKDAPDVVLVFRRSEYTPQIAQQTVAVKAKGLWLQTGIRNSQARNIAEDSGLDYIEDRCMMVEHLRRRRTTSK